MRQAQYVAHERREFNDTIGRWKIQQLIETGRGAAAQSTALWDPRDAEEARSEVARALERRVKQDWTEVDVRRLVEDTLGEWEEIDDDDEAARRADEDEEQEMEGFDDDRGW